MEKSDLWSSYYETGEVDSSTMEFTPDARIRIQDAWTSVFAGLPPDSRVLDLGTGGGALLGIAAGTAGPDHRLELTGVDFATTRPESAPASTDHCRITYQGGIEMDALPFDDQSFDLVVSQFAVEYGDFSETVREAARVSGQYLVALVHARGGAVVRQNAPIADQIDWLLDELDIVDLLRHHITHPTPEIDRQLKAAGAKIGEACANLENPSFLRGLAGNIGQFLLDHRRNVPEENLERLAEFDRRLRNQASRMKALAIAARSPEEMDKACATCLEAGLDDARWREQRSDNDRHLIGYWLTAQGRSSGETG